MTTSLARSFADNYSEATLKGDSSAIKALFASDAVFFAFNDQILRGADEIGNFFEKYLAHGVPMVRIASFIESGNVCVFEFEVKKSGEEEWKLAAIDHATLGVDGKVTRFAIYLK